MEQSDAANILGLQDEITPEITKKAYRDAAKKYHPDINPAGSEMMKIINSAFEALKNFTGIFDEKERQSNYPEALNEALNSIISLDGLIIEICGAWIWVVGDTFTHKTRLQENGFRYAGKKKAWNFRPENWKSRGRGQSSMEDIRNKYGSQEPKMANHQRLSYGAL